MSRDDNPKAEGGVTKSTSVPSPSAAVRVPPKTASLLDMSFDGGANNSHEQHSQHSQLRWPSQ